MSERREKWPKGTWWVDPHRNVVCGGLLVAYPSVQHGEEAELATVQLIAAAPELYEVLSDTVQFIGWDEAPESRIERILDRIECALAKARGEA